jgi:hypothetical protein
VNGLSREEIEKANLKLYMNNQLISKAQVDKFGVPFFDFCSDRLGNYGAACTNRGENDPIESSLPFAGKTIFSPRIDVLDLRSDISLGKHVTITCFGHFSSAKHYYHDSAKLNQIVTIPLFSQ